MPVQGALKKRIGPWIFVIVAALCFCFAAQALGSSEHEVAGAHGDAHGAPGWVATDTYRVICFAVLVIALILILRKPVKQALNNRVDGIRSELAELEEKKAAAEAKLVEYDQKLASLDKEAEAILAEYIRQGQEAKARIISEAEAASEKLEAQAKRNIDSEFKRAKDSLYQEVFEKALVKAEGLVKRMAPLRPTVRSLVASQT